MLFQDRSEAGKALADRLANYANRSNVVVLALPRGGVPVGLEVARSLHAPLDVFLVRKLGVPGQQELAMGAIATGGVRVLNEDVVQVLGISEEVIDSVAAREQQELERREALYRDDRPPLEVEDRIAILIDDGVATGSTMKAAVMALRRRQAARIVVAVPVGASETCAELCSTADEVICLHTPERFYAVGLWYENFSQTTDEEVRDLLEKAAESSAAVYPHA